ncbi:hypothetical protein RF11_07820 [Thelohanellus kitauei]|uniref:Uncharacterized protein n=1 Tax=Thelohanellus kitauei TaxID=669202 RepID=A0A0C2MT93_THEKT|nr:hypothetical protein RF11_07820 [Thelohanellus kitauei]
METLKEEIFLKIEFEFKKLTCFARDRVTTKIYGVETVNGNTVVLKRELEKSTFVKKNSDSDDDENSNTPLDDECHQNSKVEPSATDNHLVTLLIKKLIDLKIIERPKVITEIKSPPNDPKKEGEFNYSTQISPINSFPKILEINNY